MTQPNSIFNPRPDPIANRANWIGRYLAVESGFSEKLAKVLTEAASNIDEYFGDLVKDNVSTKVARVRIGLANKEIRRQFRDIFGTTRSLIVDHQQDAAVAAVNAKLYDERGVLSWLLPDPVNRVQYADTLRQTARRNIEATIARTLFTEQPLSARVYKTEALANGIVSRTINNALARGDSARNLAKDVRALIDPTVPGGVSYAAMRLGRTEINNAFHAQSILDSQETPWVQDMRWYLSKRHEKDPGDECEIYAAQGLFRKEDVPEKPHPNCRCFVTPELQDYEDFENALISGHYDPYLDSVMGEGFSSSQIEQQSGAFAERKPTKESNPETKWTGPKTVAPLEVEFKGSKSHSFVDHEAKHGIKSSRKKAQEVADNILVNNNIDEVWQSTRFDSIKVDFRLGGRDAQRVSYERFPSSVKEQVIEAISNDNLEQIYNDPAILRVYGKEIVARAAHSDPTTAPIYRGMMIEADELHKFMPGEPMSLPLSSFDTDESFAIDFAQGKAWRAKETQALQDPFPIIIQLEDGARVAKMGGSERVAFGQFEIIDVNPPENVTVVRLSQEVITEKPTVIVVRQKSMIEPEIWGGRMSESNGIADYAIGDDIAESFVPQGKMTRETLARVKKLLPNARIDLSDQINEEVFKEIVDNLEPWALEYPESASSIKAFGFKDMPSGIDEQGRETFTAGIVKTIQDDYPEEFKAFGGQGVTVHFDATLASTKNGLRDSVIRSSKETRTRRGLKSPLQYEGVAEDPLKTLVTHELVHVRHFNMGGAQSRLFRKEWRGLDNDVETLRESLIVKAFEAAVPDKSKHNGQGLNEWFDSVVSEMPRYAGIFQEASPSSFGTLDTIEAWAVAIEQVENRPDQANEIDRILYKIFNEIWEKYLPKKRRRRSRKK